MGSLKVIRFCREKDSKMEFGILVESQSNVILDEAGNIVEMVWDYWDTYALGINLSFIFDSIKQFYGLESDRQ